MASFSSGEMIKNPNVSGQFYDANPQRLSAHIDAFMQAADVEPFDKPIEILIAPHAGYVFSGGVAAYGFKAAGRQKYKTIIVLAPSHYYPFNGFSVWQEGGFKTPLGVMDVDTDFARALMAGNDNVFFQPEVFGQEHALEVELPFLQKTFEGFKIVPILAGQSSLDVVTQLAESLDRLIGDRRDVLLVASSDMSHFHDYQTAVALDRKALDAVEKLDVENFWKECRRRKSGNMEMCGFVPVTTALLLAQKRNLSVKVLKYANSGDVIPDKNRVVGYTSVVFYRDAPVDPDPPEPEAQQDPDNGVAPLTLEQKRRLMQIAQETIVQFIRTGAVPEFNETDPRLLEIEGAFVTIHKRGRLRGCIGNIIGRDELYQTVQNMAVAAATQDPRFRPLTAVELNEIDVEISVLSKPRATRNVDEIKMGKHGVIVSRGFMHQGVFLPQVATETGWSKEQFLSQLCAQKAGLEPDAWKDPATRLEIFTADVFSEEDIK